MTLQIYRQKVDRLATKYQLATERLRIEEEELGVVKVRLKDTQEAQTITQQVAQSIQQRAHTKIASVVTKCLNAVFVDDPYEFRIRFDRKRGKTEARLTFHRDGVEREDPMNEIGGGVIDVASFGLRLACILLGTRPLRKRLVVLDEPFKNIRGEQNKQRTRSMLLALAEELEFQFVINTDFSHYRLGIVVELG